MQHRAALLYFILGQYPSPPTKQHVRHCSMLKQVHALQHAEPAVHALLMLMQASMSAALQRGQSELQAHSGSGVVVVCGSLHAVAEAQKHLKAL